MNYLSWRCDGRSIQGASHQRTGLVNQDAIHCETLKIGQQQALIMVVSDGHGGESYFRSHIGANYAVKVAANIVKGTILKQDSSRSLKQIQHQLPQQIVEQWRRSVITHVKRYPITEAEWEKLQVQEPWQGDVSRSQIEQDLAIAYGATLLMVVITDKFAIYFQIGDGDILCVQSDGTIQHPLPPDPRLVANRTISLCTPQVWQESRFKIVYTALPAMILASTDGYANSYATDEDFQQIGADYLRKIRQEGFDRVIANLPIILQETSRRGSGDDVTLGIMYLEGANPAVSLIPENPPLSTVIEPVRISATQPGKRSWFWVMPIPILVAGIGYFVFLQQRSMTNTVPPAIVSPSAPVQVSPSPKQSPRPKPKKTQEKVSDDLGF
ncbi:PP2C family serine/threonine-protein phosphatase [Leptolyngbya sp. AN03gr2]|uniref:PP2C family serine/threonine-protein phosphatase n=1 Tax=unclassified Leptolyngbya TaxID=2650499 RepID=UPI003D31B2B6